MTRVSDEDIRAYREDGAICLRGVLVRKRDTSYPAVGLAATALIAVHSAVDFSLQIPGVAVPYFALLGAACAQSWPTSQRGARRHGERAGKPD